MGRFLFLLVVLQNHPKRENANLACGKAEQSAAILGASHGLVAPVSLARLTPSAFLQLDVRLDEANSAQKL